MTEVTRRKLNLDGGIDMNVAEMGSGRPLIFIHGSGPGASGWNNFRGNAKVLAAQGYRCLMPDLVGFGHSSKPTDITFSLEYLASTILKLIETDKLTDVVLVGNSLGGAVAIQCALERPDLVSKLVLMAPGWLEEREVFAAMEGIQAMRHVLMDPEGLKLENLQRTLKLMFADSNKLPAGLAEERFDLAQLQNDTIYTNMSGSNLTPRLGELRLPVLGFWGGEDRFCPPSGALHLVTGVQDCKVVMIARCGHWFMMEEAELFNREVLEFVRK
ncbi:alpha/beta fold hydrolase [Hyphomonas sp.]|uniref:alpha/beta fold hydrolase n=1 Tax=Hyphomonas sp. TaxID=87 RepID=UPI00352708CE